MNRTALRSLSLLATLAAVVGCQSAPHLAWWKQDKVAENSAVAATSKTPALPSAQSSPSPVAIAGVTPGATSPATAMAAATPAVGATAFTSPAVSPPNAPLSIPVAASAPLSASPPPTENSLADKLVLKPKSSATAPLAATTPPPASTVAASGPYDPNAYKPTQAMASSNALGNGTDGPDRYGAIASAAPTASPASLPPASPSQALASDPADRYGAARTSTTPTAMPGQTPMTDPTALSSDRYANPKLPSYSTKAAATLAATGVSASVPPVKLASAPGQYRPGGTSSYPDASSTTSPVEIASRPAPPSAMPPAAADTGSQPWSPGSTTAQPTSRPY
jgi:hypothetical protein